MSETISKSAVCEIIADIYPTDGEKVVDVKQIDKAYEAILQLPSAEPERKTGRWFVIHAPDDLHCGLVKCPFCGELLVGEPNEYNFCSNCGADMRGGSNGKNT